MSIERLHVDRDEIEASLDEALEQHDETVMREISDREVSIAAWADGDPARAMAIADRWSERMRNLALRRQLVNAVYEERVRPLEEWREQQLAAIEREEDFGRNLLEVYLHDFHPDEKTVRLSRATLKRRANRDRREWDEDAALRYQEHVAPEDVKRVLNKAALMERLVRRDGRYYDPDTGEEVEFVRDVPPEEPERFIVAVEIADD